MTLYEKIISLYPELNANDFHPLRGTILLQNDSNDIGDYIVKWNHPILAEPTTEQLA